MPVDARRFIRKMRGGAQAHLLEASDGHFYVVKFVNNPQHRRILVNEWIAAGFLDFLGISHPPAAMIRVSEEFLNETPEAHFQLGQEKRRPLEGWHFGSRYPGHPDRLAVYDFLPDALLGGVENLTEFLGALAFDKWISNSDSRQSIFFRARLRTHEGSSPWQSASTRVPRLGFVAQMMDNGYIFDGPNWKLTDSPLQGLYFRPLVYRSVRGMSDFEPWLERIRHFPEEVVDQTVKQIPAAWLEEDGDDFERLLEQLLARRKRVPDLIQACRSARVDPFPSWGL